MENLNRIYWKKGLDVTPEIFIDSDNFHIRQQSNARQLSAFRSFGVLPNSHFFIDKEIINNHIVIKQLHCCAVTHEGYWIEINNDVPLNDINLDNCPGGEFYVVLKVNPYVLECVEEDLNHAREKYHLELIEAGENISSGIILLKIYYGWSDAESKKKWIIEEDYIVPSVSVCSDSRTIQKYDEIRNEADNIVEKLRHDDFSFFQLALLMVELKNYSLSETPNELVLLLKKIVTVLKLHLKKKAQTPSCAAEFIEMQYNHNEIASMLNLGLKCLVEINQQPEIKPELPPPPPPPQPKEILPKI